MLRKIQKEVFETTIPHPRDQTMVADTKIIPFITTYSSHSTVMGRQIKRNFQETMGNQFVNQPTKVISAFRRNPNLKDLLVRAKLPLLGTSVQIPQDTMSDKN
ncbi:Glycerol-3-phosphate 2-O-acyltransferase 4 [Dissostichus eleginoides]|uniref:Glycerol-3-phosphate 2-O-acyltransferase 4 n=1 Tax=Dissostichus eleginoides TaxID=100907 RepID=A0AAD9B5H1_DISEL|nr:Glycerol-3-phosphate 2-O-acyltransferase 4 [Dissostichus eleginoides]